MPAGGPWRRSLVEHFIFGFGLYDQALSIAPLHHLSLAFLELAELPSPHGPTTCDAPSNDRRGVLRPRLFARMLRPDAARCLCEIARAGEMAVHAGSIKRDHLQMLLSIPQSLSGSRAVQRKR